MSFQIVVSIESFGKILFKLIKQKKIKITDLSKKLNISRATLYEIFKKDSMEIDLLYRLSIILNKDLMTEYYNYQKNKGKIHSQDILDDNFKIFCLKSTGENDKFFNKLKIKDSIIQIRSYIDNIKNELDKLEEYVNDLE